MRIKIRWRRQEDTVVNDTEYQPHTSYLRLFSNDDRGHEFFIPWDVVEEVEAVKNKQLFFGEEEPKKEK